MSRTVSLSRREAHLWYLFRDEVNDPNVLKAHYDLMAPDEKTRYDRFAFERHRKEYMLAHALVRLGLSSYTDVHPSKWVFDKNRHGRPEIAYPPVMPRLRFNLSHTDGIVACAFVLDQDIGLDIEDTRRQVEMKEISDRYFSTDEKRCLELLPIEEKRNRFFDYWTLKEAYIKARGLGLSLPLNLFSFHLNEDDIRVSFEPEIHDDAQCWQFQLVDITTCYRTAVAVRREEGNHLTIHVRNALTLLQKAPNTHP